MEMFAKNLYVSFTTIVLVFTSCVAYNHADELPKFPFFDTPGSSDISRSSLGGTYDTTKSSIQAQQPPLEVEDPVPKPVGLSLNGWGRIPRDPKLNGWGRIPRAPKLDGWGRIPRVPKFSQRGSDQLRLPPIRPQSVEQQKVRSAHVPSPPIKAHTSVTEPPTLSPAKPPSPALDLLNSLEWAAAPTV
ncbi:hypothetical protein AgCh_021701 [Apium graveolens]